MEYSDKLKCVDQAIKDYTEMSKKGTKLEEIEKRCLNRGLCFYFRQRFDLYLKWKEINDRPVWICDGWLELYGWPIPDYEYEEKKKNKRGIKDRLQFLIKNRKLIVWLLSEEDPD